MKHPEITTREEHKHCFNNREEIASSEQCGCFYCLSIFSPADIEDWIDKDKTAMCPKCGIDSVLAEFTPDLLKKMQQEWF